MEIWVGEKSREFSAAALGEIHETVGRIFYFGHRYTQRAEMIF
jgi:hypothetical protein